jgi:hypothetical protein
MLRRQLGNISLINIAFTLIGQHAPRVDCRPACVRAVRSQSIAEDAIRMKIAIASGLNQGGVPARRRKSPCPVSC